MNASSKISLLLSLPFVTAIILFGVLHSRAAQLDTSRRKLASEHEQMLDSFSRLGERLNELRADYENLRESARELPVPEFSALNAVPGVAPVEPPRTPRLRVSVLSSDEIGSNAKRRIDRCMQGEPSRSTAHFRGDNRIDGSVTWRVGTQGLKTSTRAIECILASLPRSVYNWEGKDREITVDVGVP